MTASGSTSEPFCGDIVVSGVICHGVIDGTTITLHDHKSGTAWNEIEDKP